MSAAIQPSVPPLPTEPFVAEPLAEQKWTAPIEDVAGDGLVAVGVKRCFSYRTLGTADGQPVIALHGTPGSRLKFVGAHAAAQQHGIRLIAPDRWGYGATTAHEAPTLSRFARDIGHFADRLGLGRFGVLGIAGGGPFAVAIAAEMPERVTSLALAAPVGPIAGEPEDEITPFHRLCFATLSQQRPAVEAAFQAFRTILDVSPDAGVRAAMLRIAAADRRMLLRKDIATHIGQTFIEGLRPGVVGPVTDLSLFGTPWHVDLARVRAPARIWLGSEDENIPRSAALRLAAQLPQCEFTDLSGEGHLWIADHFETVLSWMAGHGK
ncbi:MAG: alpha/beta fold hydrolase [Hyphomicrobiaceae bacterium]